MDPDPNEFRVDPAALRQVAQQLAKLKVDCEALRDHGVTLQDGVRESYGQWTRAIDLRDAYYNFARIVNNFYNQMAISLGQAAEATQQIAANYMAGEQLNADSIQQLEKGLGGG
jgi:beta-lactamase class D